MMKKTSILARPLVTGALIILLSATISQDVVADQNGRSFVGSWIVEVFPNPPGPPPFTNLGTINRDGTVSNSDPAFGGGHGVWKRIKRGKNEIKFLTLVPPGDPFFPANAIITVTGFVTVNRSGDEASGPFNTEFTDTDGNLLFSFDGEVRFTRIKIDDDSDSDDD